MWPAIVSAVSTLLSKVFDVVDKSIEDKDKAAELKASLQNTIIGSHLEELKAASSIIVAEAQGESWLQRSWRPITMLTFVSLIVARWLGLAAPGITETLEMKLMSIVEIGLGGYVIGRSLEKTAALWKVNGN